MMRALVTGGTGFLGRTLIRHLETLGWTVLALGRREAAVQTLVTDRVDDVAEIVQAFAIAQPDVVFHLAGTTAGPPDEMARVNIGFARALLGAAQRRAPCPAVLLAGTAAEYGPLAEGDSCSREDHPCLPVNAYGATKLRQTELGLAAARGGLSVFLPRLFNLIGPGMGRHLSLGRFAYEIAALQPHGGVLVTGPLFAERDFVAVDDAVRVLTALWTLPQASGRVVNVCSARTMRIGAMLDLLIAASNCPVTVQIAPGISGVSGVERFIGSPLRLRSLGLTIPAPDYAAEMARLLRSYRSPEVRSRLAVGVREASGA